MKNLLTMTVSLMFILVACVPATAEVSIATAEVSTVLPEGYGGGGTEAPYPTPAPSTPIPPIPGLSPTELKYLVLDEFPDFFFCDPDYYPIAREDENVLAQDRFPEIQANKEEFNAILQHTGLAGTSSFTDGQKLLIYREHKKLTALYFELVDGKYRFQIQTGAEGQEGKLITGTIDGNGKIKVEKRDPGFPTCPICLAAGSLIDTPLGLVAVENLRIGDPVWTLNAAGERVAGIIQQTGHMTAPASHQIVHLRLGDGRELWASPGHPTADKRLLGDVSVGDRLDGARVTFVELLPYGGLTTFDILPSGDTGFYWVNGILMGSTLTDD
jgi:hypothetical protein